MTTREMLDGIQVKVNRLGEMCLDVKQLQAEIRRDLRDLRKKLDEKEGKGPDSGPQPQAGHR